MTDANKAGARKLSAKQIVLLQNACEAAIKLVRSGEAFYSSAADWYGHEVEGYNPRLYSRGESILTDWYVECVFEEMKAAWNAFVHVRSFYQSEHGAIRTLRLATPMPVGIDFGLHVEYSQSCFESAYRFGITACQFMPDCGSTNGGFWDEYQGPRLPFTIEGVRQRCAEMLRGYVEFYGIPHNLRSLMDKRVPPWLEIAKEAQRATGQLLPSMMRVYGPLEVDRERLGRLSPSTQTAIKSFREGLSVEAVCERLRISADNARTIKSRYSDLIGET
ncbi:hypothetical protein [Botrimarina mediterranea]|uniref:Uncharacterized protein n=1 Tax=Botrimarina mediterranea TaxID=2528022 RepID=A0A518K3W6_9BACT|nr:hypothetical protein [Botrimarina mediterranea]QDV72481.1 hypothetical protein Spa11_06590 [Botrimarina mediterranea]